MKRLSLLLISFSFLSACIRKPEPKQVDENNPFYEKAISFREVNEVDSSFKYFNRAKDEFLLQNDSLGAGKCLVNMGFIAKVKGDYYSSQEISLDAIAYFDESKKNQAGYICSNFNTLGLSSYQLKDYASALKFYYDALKFVDTPLNKFICLNNIAKAYEELKNYQEAIKIYNIVLKGTANHPAEYAMALANLSFTKWLQNPTYNPLPELLKALTIRKNENDNLGQNHSYARLADYYTNKNLDSAFINATKMHQVAQELNSMDDRLSALCFSVS